MNLGFRILSPLVMCSMYHVARRFCKTVINTLAAWHQAAAGDQARQEATQAKSLYEAALEGRVRAPPEVTRTLLESLGALAAAAGVALEREHAALQARQASNTRLLTSRCSCPRVVGPQ